MTLSNDSPAPDVPRLTEPVTPSVWDVELAAARLGIRPLKLELGVTDHPNGPYSWVRYQTTGAVHSQQHRVGVPLVVAAAVAVAKAATVARTVLSVDLALDDRLAELIESSGHQLPAKLSATVEQTLRPEHGRTSITRTGHLPAPHLPAGGAHAALESGIGLVEALRAMARELGVPLVYADGSFVFAPVTAGGWSWWSPAGYQAGGRPTPSGALYHGLRDADRFELEAVHQAAAHAHEGRDLIVLSDSDAAYEVAGGQFQAAGRKVTLALITGHTDPYGHNHADRLARHAATLAANAGEARTLTGTPSPHQLRPR